MSGDDPTSASIYPSLSYEDAPAAIEWLCQAFGFEQRLVVPDDQGGVIHSELSLGSGVIMVNSVRPSEGRLSPRTVGGVTQALAVWVQDPEAHCARAVAAGATITRTVQDEEFGGRGYMAKDPEGHQWYFGSYRPGAHWGDCGPTEPC